MAEIEFTLPVLSLILIGIGICLLALPIGLIVTVVVRARFFLRDGAIAPRDASQPWHNALPISVFQMGRLKDYIENCGVLWRGVVQEGQLKAGGPYCTEDRALLEYNTSRKKFKPLTLHTAETKPFPPGTTGLSAPSYDDLIARFLATPAPSKTEDDEEYEIRDLREDDTSTDKAGPYCVQCKRLRKMPGRVGDCRWEALQKIEAEHVVVA